MVTIQVCAIEDLRKEYLENMKQIEKLKNDKKMDKLEKAKEIDVLEITNYRIKKVLEKNGNAI